MAETWKRLGRLGKLQFSELQKARDLDLGSGHTAYRRASVIDLYVHTKFIEIGQSFCGRTYECMDGRADGRTYLLTDGHFPSNVVRSSRRSRPKYINK